MSRTSVNYLLLYGLACFILACATWRIVLMAGEPKNIGPGPNQSFLSPLKKDSIVMMKEMNGRYEFTILKKMFGGHRVTEVGADWVVVQDAAGISEYRIPIYSIKSIVKMNLPAD